MQPLHLAVVNTKSLLKLTWGMCKSSDDFYCTTSKSEKVPTLLSLNVGLMKWLSNWVSHVFLCWMSVNTVLSACLPTENIKTKCQQCRNICFRKNIKVYELWTVERMAINNRTARSAEWDIFQVWITFHKICMSVTGNGMWNKSIHNVSAV